MVLADRSDEDIGYDSAARFEFGVAKKRDARAIDRNRIPDIVEARIENPGADIAAVVCVVLVHGNIAVADDASRRETGRIARSVEDGGRGLVSNPAIRKGAREDALRAAVGRRPADRESVRLECRDLEVGDAVRGAIQSVEDDERAGGPRPPSSAHREDATDQLRVAARRGDPGDDKAATLKRHHVLLRTGGNRARRRVDVGLGDACDGIQQGTGVVVRLDVDVVRCVDERDDRFVEAADMRVQASDRRIPAVSRDLQLGIRSSPNRAVDASRRRRSRRVAARIERDSEALDVNGAKAVGTRSPLDPNGIKAVHDRTSARVVLGIGRKLKIVLGNGRVRRDRDLVAKDRTCNAVVVAKLQLARAGIGLAPGNPVTHASATAHQLQFRDVGACGVRDDHLGKSRVDVALLVEELELD